MPLSLCVLLADTGREQIIHFTVGIVTGEHNGTLRRVGD